MSFWDIFKRRPQVIQGPPPPAEKSFDNGVGLSVISGMQYGATRRGVGETLAAFQTSPWFRGVVARVAWAAAVEPWKVMAVRAMRGKKDFVSHWQFKQAASFETRNKIEKELKQAGRLVEIEDHPFVKLLADPCPALTGVDMRFVLFGSLAVAGEIGMSLVRAPGKPPEEMWPVPAHWIVRRPGDPGSSGNWQVRIGNSIRAFSEDEFILFRNPTLENPYGRGSGFGIALNDELELDEYISKYEKTFFQHRGRPDLVFTVTAGDAGELRRQKERFQEEYGDARKSGRSMWVRGDDIKVQELSQKMIDMDATQKRTWIKDLVREVLGVPPEIMGDVKDSNRSTINDARYILAELSTIPMLERLCAQFQKHVIPMYDDRLVCAYADPRPDDREYKLKVATAAPWSITRGEWRVMSGHEDRGKADNVHEVPQNLIEVPGPLFVQRSISSTHRDLVLSALRQKMVTDTDVNAIADALDGSPLETEMSPELEQTVSTWGARTMAAVESGAAFDMVDPAVVAHLEDFSAARVGMINKTTRKALRATLGAGVANGMGADELRRAVQDQFSQFSKTRAMNIARTEVNRSANFGVFEGHRQSGVVQQRGWLATLDDRTRDLHAGLNGQIRAIDKPFEIEGYKTMYPGGSGDAEFDVACRCTTYAVVSTPRAAPAMILKSFIDETDKDERRVVAAVRRAFAQQLDQVLGMLEKLS